MVSETSSGREEVIRGGGSLPFQDFRSEEITPSPSPKGTALVTGWQQTLSTAVIMQRPSVMGGSPVIAGTRIRVSDVVRHRALRGRSVARIRQALPHLTPDQIKAALRYYQTHRAEIDAEIEVERGLALDASKTLPR